MCYNFLVYLLTFGFTYLHKNDITSLLKYIEVGVQVWMFAGIKMKMFSVLLITCSHSEQFISPDSGKHIKKRHKKSGTSQMEIISINYRNQWHRTYTHAHTNTLICQRDVLIYFYIFRANLQQWQNVMLLKCSVLTLS